KRGTAPLPWCTNRADISRGMQYDPQMSQNLRMYSPYRFAAVAAAVASIVLPMLAQAPPAPAPTRQAVIDELVVANHILANEGILDGYGHVSVRNPTDPTRYFLARAGAPALVKAADITEYNLASEAITNTINPGG